MRTIKNNVIEPELSYRLVGIFFTVHKELGRYCRGRQYCDALEIQFKSHNLRYQREHPFMVAGRLSNRVDFMVEEKIIVEVKAKPFLQEADFIQIKRYVQSANMKLGMIVNFRAKYINPKRVLNPAFATGPHS